MSARWGAEGPDRQVGWRLVVAHVCTGLVAVGIGLASGAFSAGAHADQLSASPHPPRRADPSSPVRSPAAATAAFGLDLLGKLPPGNAVISPDSIATALAMAGTGAKGPTAEQIAGALHLNVTGPTGFEGVGKLQHALARGQAAAAAGHPEADAPELKIANGLFVQQGLSLRTQFVGGLQEDFGTAPEGVDFAGDPSGATAAINSWTSANTDGLIPGLFSELPATTRLILANAVYLKAKWRDEFKASATSPAPFHRDRGDVSTEFMHQTIRLSYAAGPNFSAVELPYRASNLSLLVVLPGGAGLAALESELGKRGLGSVVHFLAPETVKLSLPRFHLDTETELTPILKALGVTLPFSAAADFSGITAAEPLRISKVKHIADIEVDEEGTEAAAVTGIGVVAVSAPAPPLKFVVFKADHPFLFFVRDDKTGAILFAGRLTDPQGT
jgi:serpin B